MSHLDFSRWLVCVNDDEKAPREWGRRRQRDAVVPSRSAPDSVLD